MFKNHKNKIYKNWFNKNHNGMMILQVLTNMIMINNQNYSAVHYKK
jgi:hypothetical protein